MYEYQALVTRIIDGDTFDAEVDLGFCMTAKVRFRLMGYNAPETHGPEKVMGQQASDALGVWLWQHKVKLRTYKGDAFGRWLADAILPDGTDVVSVLVSRGLGVRWDGKDERPKFDPGGVYPLNR